MKKSHRFVLTVALGLFTAAQAAKMTPFVIPAEIPTDSAIAMQHRPLTEQDRLIAKDHFYTQTGSRVRLWGVNLSFEANFPTHADAERIAQRIAASGVNTVRCHHMDTANWPRGIWDKTGRDLHPEALDRLDYFINQLAQRGIYANINLHVGKKHSAVLDIPESAREYDKMVDIFTPELIDAQKDYARKLLRHKNPYRNNVPYAEDVAVAIVEITNEDSLFMWDAENTLRTLPPFYAKLLQKQYNTWLKEKYTTQQTLKTQWLPQSEPLGENILKDASLKESVANNTPWRLEQHAGCRASLQNSEYQNQQALCIQPAKTDGTGWHLQFNQGQLSLQKDQSYTIEFKAAAAEPRQINVGVLQAHEPWGNLGLSQSLQLESDWKTVRMHFVASDNDTNARLSFYLGNDDKPFYLKDVKLCTGVEYTLNKDESLDNATIALFGDSESPRRQMDRMIFLAQTEKTYFDQMRNFVKDELNCKAMITGTIVFGPLALDAQSDMDFIDGHAYWQHPRFPNRPWDPADWLIDQKAMTDNPHQATLYQLAAQRLKGKPFTVTEYNHPAPLDAQAECVPMIASFAAAQDWDGVWLYTYSHSNANWDRQNLYSFFDIDTNPAKWGFMPAAAAIYKDAALQPFGDQTVWSMASPDQDRMDALAQFQNQIDRNLAAFLQTVFQQNMATRLYGVFQQTPQVQQGRTGGNVSAKADLQWNVINNQGLYVMRNDRCCVLTGHTSRFAEIDHPVSLQINSPGFAAVTIVSLDNEPLDHAKKILITACGRCENTGMQFSEDRRTVSTHWGTAPVLIETVQGAITLPASTENRKTTCKILNPDSTVKQQVNITNNQIELKPEHAAMGYLIERQ